MAGGSGHTAWHLPGRVLRATPSACPPPRGRRDRRDRRDRRRAVKDSGEGRVLAPWSAHPSGRATQEQRKATDGRRLLASGPVSLLTPQWAGHSLCPLLSGGHRMAGDTEALDCPSVSRSRSDSTGQGAGRETHQIPLLQKCRCRPTPPPVAMVTELAEGSAGPEGPRAPLPCLLPDA